MVCFRYWKLLHLLHFTVRIVLITSIKILNTFSFTDNIAKNNEHYPVVTLGRLSRAEWIKSHQKRHNAYNSYLVTEALFAMWTCQLFVGFPFVLKCSPFARGGFKRCGLLSRGILLISGEPEKM